MPDFPAGAETARAAKNALRSQLLTERRTLAPVARRTAAIEVQASTITLVRRLAPATTAAYVPVGSEPGGDDLLEALTRALPPGGRLLLPVLRPDADLDWAVHTGSSSLAPGPRGLREPTGVRLGVEAVREADLVIVPALAVDMAGIRLGRGGGSYDRVLRRTTSAVAVALLYDAELLDRVPAEPHDRPVQMAITPTRGCVTFT